MVEWLAGNRIRGTSTERASADFNAHLISPDIGGWKELGRTTLGSAGNNIAVSSLADKRYYMLLCDDRNSGVLNVGHRAGNGSLDTNSNYGKRPSINGVADITTHHTQNNFLEDALNHSDNMFMVNYISNLSNKEKLGIGHCVRQNTAGVGNAPNRTEYVGKWANTSNVIDTLSTVNFGSGDLDSDSELVVLGWDPDDTHTSNFWEELADVSWTSGSTFATPTFAAKKYLWIQMYKSGTNSTNISCRLNFNDDTGTNYNRRLSSNGGTDWVGASSGYDGIHLSPNNTTADYCNIFMINNSANEKLIIAHIINAGYAGSNYPTRMELVGKWTNTSSQVTKVHMTSVNNDFIAGSRIKVWGSN